MARKNVFRTDDQSRFGKLLLSLCEKYSSWSVWADFVTLAAISLSNAFDCDSHIHGVREAEYLSIINRYTQEERMVLPKLLAVVVEALEDDPEQDFLGDAFSVLGLQSHWKGQFFTPYNVSQCIAKCSLIGIDEEISKHDWIAVTDPCCGAGSLLIAVRNELVRMNIPSTSVLFVAQDVDRVAALMCYIQLSLLGCAGYVKVGDSLKDPAIGIGRDPLLPVASSNDEIWYLPMLFQTVWQRRIYWSRLEEQIKERCRILMSDSDNGQSLESEGMKDDSSASLDNV